MAQDDEFQQQITALAEPCPHCRKPSKDPSRHSSRPIMPQSHSSQADNVLRMHSPTHKWNETEGDALGDGAAKVFAQFCNANVMP